MTATPATTASPTQVTHRRPLLINIKQAAEMLALSRSSIYQLIWNEQLVPIRIGRSVRFPIEQIEEFVTRRIAGSSAELRPASSTEHQTGAKSKG